LAYWERKTIKEVMDEALSSYLEGRRIDPTRERIKENRIHYCDGDEVAEASHG